ncbi:hypothetical protein [Amycolatopsis tucumanensis]|uniref:TIR domain-containing protein n=1 Tax=Amycolatopsis tucumanensis TaxID=401106 RepID=A0ABP7I379_9PSEU|nr:hypothetical protein [Amycolatopsis tucumanensis]MCF6424805.1 hypothetical protein [Amycolatopsis tucumanensis]
MPVLYFAHSYRERDARIVDYFGRLMRSEGLVPSLDPPSDSVNGAKLQRHLNASDGMIAVLSRREDGTSPHILFELALAMRAGFPVLVFIEDTLPNDAVSPHVPQQRFSYRSFLRQAPAHRQALRFFKAYLASTPPGGYVPLGRRRSCLIVQSAPEPLVEATARWIAQYAEYEVGVLDQRTDAPPWRPFDEIRSASVLVTFASSGQPRDHLTGFATAAGVPTIELTADPGYRHHPAIPDEYQPRLVRGTEELPGVLATEFELFEQDFLELTDQDAVDRYTSFLVDLEGDYDSTTRETAMEVVMGDKYEVSGQTGAVGRNARAKDMTFQQVWQGEGDRLDLPRLAGELEILRLELKRQATTREHDAVVAEIGAAAEAAERGDGPETLSRLQRAGKWALGAATAIGTGVAAAAIKVAIGF